MESTAFQHFELFPHLSITENLTLAQIKVLNRSKEEAVEKGMRLLDVLPLEELGVFSTEESRPDLVADRVAHGIAHDRRRE